MDQEVLNNKLSVFKNLIALIEKRDYCAYVHDHEEKIFEKQVKLAKDTLKELTNEQ